MDPTSKDILRLGLEVVGGYKLSPEDFAKLGGSPDEYSHPITHKKVAIEAIINTLEMEIYP